MTSALRSDPLTDTLFMVIRGGLAQWEGTTELLARQWRSKLFLMPYPTCMQACQVRAGDYEDMTLKLYGGESTTPFFTKLVLSEMEFLLPSITPDGKPAVFTGFTAEVLGRSRVREIQLATSMEELDV